MLRESRMNSGCMRIMRTALVPIHQKKRLSSRECIADIAGTIVKSNFYFGWLSTNRTSFIHAGELSEFVRISRIENISFSATGAFVMEYTDQIGFLDAGHIYILCKVIGCSEFQCDICRISEHFHQFFHACASGSFDEDHCI